MKRNKSFEVKEMETRSPPSLQGMKKYSIISAVRNPIKKEENRRREGKRRSNMENPSSPKERKNKRRWNP